MPLILRLVIGAIVAYGLIALLAHLYADRVLFQPPPPTYGSASFGWERVPVWDEAADRPAASRQRVRSDTGDGGQGDGAVVVQHLAAPDSGFTILLSHGNAEDLGMLQPLLRLLHGVGFGVLAYDYRGYGHSTGPRPSEARAVADAEAVYAHAVDRLGIPPRRLILHGRSLGSGPALAVASRHEAAGVVVESGFTSAYRVVTGFPLLPLDRFRNLDRVRRLEVPLLVIHGEQDRVIRVSHGRALYAAAGGPKQALWVERAGHNDLVRVARDSYLRALQSFAEMTAASQE